MIKCTHCDEEKPEDCFYRQPRALSGLMSKCKECHKAAVRLRARTNPYVQEYDRRRAKLPHRLANNARISKAWRIANPEGYKAHTVVGNAIRDGRLFKSPCVACGSQENLHAHHADYTKPLDVTWYCALHHHRHHNE